MTIHLGQFDAIIFDLDSTLTSSGRYPVEASRWLLSRIVASPDEYLTSYVNELIRFYREGIDRVVQGSRYVPPFFIIRTAMEESLRSLGLEAAPMIIDEAARILKQLHLEMAVTNPGTVEVLHGLRDSGVKMGVLTNTFEGHASMILERLGLSDFFTVVVDGRMARAYKPMPEIFRLALAHLDSVADRSLYVGDEYYADIVGAAAVGIRSVWVNERNQPPDDLIRRYGDYTRPLLIVGSIRELLAYL